MSNSYILGRLEALREENNNYADDRWRVRQIMNGGPQGIAAIMAWDQGKGTSGKLSALGHDLPAVNMMASGVERLAQKVGEPPSLQMPYGTRDSDTARREAETREHIVEGWDHMSRLRLQFPQIGRWLPGYAFYAWVIRPRRDKVTGQLWPHLELRDPFDSWPGYFGVEQQPVEIAFRRDVPIEVLKHTYPEHDWDGMLRKREKKQSGSDGRYLLPSGQATGTESSWEGRGGGTQVLEYYCDEGTYVCVPEFALVLDFAPNICSTGPMFVVGKRFSFDRLQSAYHHVIGLVAQQAKFNVLALIATEDGVFRETNIIGGDVESGDYEKGRGAINYLTTGTQLERPAGDSTFGIFQQIDRLERQLRIGAAYDTGSDSIAQQGGFITGQGQRELRNPVDVNIDEYQKVIGAALEMADTRRLEWEERHEKSKNKRLFYIEGNRAKAETYVPLEAIAGHWRSRRIYGMMAGWDDNSKIVAGLQLMQAGVIDATTMRENLKGLDNLPLVEDRTLAERARNDLFAMLEAAAQQVDPMTGQPNATAAMALQQIEEHPDRTTQIFKKFFTPAPPQPTPEEAGAMAPGMPPGMPGVPPGEAELGPGPTVQTVLSEMEANGRTGGGVQTVAVNRS